jgi:hypothetical protein
VVTCAFTQWSGGKLVERGTMCKMARGEMVRYLAQAQASAPEQLMEFSSLGYRFSKEASSDTTYVFIKEEK